MKTEAEVEKFLDGLALGWANRTFTLSDVLWAAYSLGYDEGQAEGVDVAYLRDQAVE